MQWAALASASLEGTSTKNSAATEYVAECFWPGVKKNDLVRLDALVHARLDRTGGGPDRVHYRGAVLLPTDEVVFRVPSVTSDQRP